MAKGQKYCFAILPLCRFSVLSFLFEPWKYAEYEFPYGWHVYPFGMARESGKVANGRMLLCHSAILPLWHVATFGKALKHKKCEFHWTWHGRFMGWAKWQMVNSALPFCILPRCNTRSLWLSMLWPLFEVARGSDRVTKWQTGKMQFCYSAVLATFRGKSRKLQTIYCIMWLCYFSRRSWQVAKWQMAE